VAGNQECSRPIIAPWHGVKLCATFSTSTGRTSDMAQSDDAVIMKYDHQRQLWVLSCTCGWEREVLGDEWARLTVEMHGGSHGWPT